ncbi:MAG: hypothetical protein CMA59_01105 [Euryarchaeota archaeon]|nr:hypothetical protein [Euryarchaeota archaeon]
MPPWDGDLGDLPRPGRGDWLRLSASDYYQVPPQAPPNWHTVEFNLCPPQALRNLAADGIVLDAVCRVENPMAEWRRGLNGLVEVHPSRLPEYYFGPVHAVERDEESISVLVPRPRGRHVTFRPEVDPERFELLWVTIWSWSRNLMGRGTLVPVLPPEELDAWYAQGFRNQFHPRDRHVWVKAALGEIQRRRVRLWALNPGEGPRLVMRADIRHWHEMLGAEDLLSPMWTPGPPKDEAGNPLILRLRGCDCNHTHGGSRWMEHRGYNR